MSRYKDESEQVKQGNGRRAWRIGWWDDKGNKGASGPLSEVEANVVQERHRRDGRHAIKQRRAGR